jgi:tRNA(Ile)-lysidine synthase
VTTGFQAAVFEAMDRRLDHVSTAPVAVALSGGGDSLALLHLTMDWAKRHRRRVLALTVDHGLSPDSVRWTAEAGEKARAFGADWRGLAWEGPKPSTGLQAKARAARHALLAEAARKAGSRVLLIGHTADDIAESDLMRVTDTPGLGRLREWAPSPAWPEGRGVFLLRPLLSIGRAELRTYLTGKGAPWLDDPANDNLRFARIRARQTLSSAHPRGSGDPVRTACAVAKDWVPASAGMSGERGHVAGQVHFSSAGAEVARAVLTDALGSAATPALAALILSVSGTTRPPRGAELERLLGVIGAGGVATLCGCRVAATGDRVMVARARPRAGSVERPVEPITWVEHRFRAACGLYRDEASIPRA